MDHKIKMRKIAIFVILFFPLCKAFSETPRFGIGLGYPYFSIKSHPLELKYAAGEGIDVFAGRFYWNFYNDDKIRGFSGIEGGLINFDTLDIEGNGYEGGLFIGGEYFITRKLSLLIDFSPTFISLKSNDNYEASTIEMVVNFAVYYYFPGKKEEKKEMMKKHFNRANEFYKQGKYKPAIEEWKKVLEIDPNHKLSQRKIEKTRQILPEAK